MLAWGEAAGVSDDDAGGLGHLLHLSTQLTPPFHRQRGDLKPDDLGIYVRVNTQVASQDRPFDLLDGGRIERFDYDHARVGCRDRRQLPHDLLICPLS